MTEWKPRAQRMRAQGNTIRFIAEQLGVPMAEVAKFIHALEGTAPLAQPFPKPDLAAYKPARFDA